jgi:hypothetical protein
VPGLDNDDKTPVFGMVQRGGRVLAVVTPDGKGATLFPIIAELCLERTQFKPSSCLVLFFEGAGFSWTLICPVWRNLLCQNWALESVQLLPE